MNLQTLEQFRESLFDEKKLKLVDIIFQCANFTNENPHFLNSIGVAWFMSDKLIINSLILGSFIRYKPNTMNRNLRHLGFPLYKKVSQEMSKRISWTYPELIQVENEPHWIIRLCPNEFNRNSTNGQFQKIKLNNLPNTGNDSSSEDQFHVDNLDFQPSNLFFSIDEVDQNNNQSQLGATSSPEKTSESFPNDWFNVENADFWNLDFQLTKNLNLDDNLFDSYQITTNMYEGSYPFLLE